VVAIAAVTLAQAPLPDTSAFLRQAVDALREDGRLQEQFTYIEESRDVTISRLGKVTVGPMRRFEVFPSSEPGGTYKRLVAVDGVPLSPEELAKQDEERREDLRKAERHLKESPSERARREREREKARRERDRLIDDAAAIFEPTVEAREWIEGEPVIRVALRPRPDARPQTREGGWARSFAGRVWFSERNHQLVRAEFEAERDVAIGWGIVGRIHRGSRLSLVRRRFQHVWLPGRFTFEASGRTLLFRKFDVVVERTYSGYRRLETEAAP
jgi:hypothetical protein